MAIQFRESKPADLSLVFDSWMRSWRTSKWAGVIPNNLYFDTMRTLIEDLLARGAKVTVAVHDENPDLILGWACYEVKENRTVLHYIYVKDVYVGSSFAIAEKLLDTLPGDKPGFITFKLPHKDLKTWTHAPEIARRLAL